MKDQWTKIPELLTAVSDHLLQIAIYDLHSGAEKCIVILEEDPKDFFGSMEPVLNYTRKAKLPLPLIVNREFISYSLDSYPLEFINISSDYENIFCKEDILNNLSFENRDVRLQIEREIKSKWLLTRMAVLENIKDIKGVHRILRMSVEAIIPALKGFCYLKGVAIPKDLNQLFDLVNELTEFDTNPIRQIYSISRNEINKGLVYSYLDNLDSIAKIMETWQL
ncbi:MAG: hypothetical protein CVU48_01085 [Candidatus Cloacimonetes bacterium HGW-Cloacimonetes-1]|nr:MAG: hypothetical protein CVU48_01085 [Candidatus Cloacimonetes bacterium HGW-Cloacimonetes-1]